MQSPQGGTHHAAMNSHETIEVIQLFQVLEEKEQHKKYTQSADDYQNVMLMGKKVNTSSLKTLGLLHIGKISEEASDSCYASFRDKRLFQVWNYVENRNWK